jgi:tetratricopeptide (TPR) repeat protein
MEAPSRIDGPDRRSGASGLPEEEGRSKVSDKLIAEATKEFDEGVVNQPLWMRILVKHGGDKAAAKSAYLRARAAELRAAHREGAAPDGSLKLAREFLNSESARVGSVPTPSRPVKQPAKQPKERPTKEFVARVSNPQRLYMIGGAAVLGLVMIAVWFLVRRDGATAPSVAPANAPAATRAAKQAADEVQGSSKADSSAGTERPNFERRVRELADAGNWNVFVLFAAEWTRKEPGNAAAWTQLSVGYTKLRQFKDALDAATKAIQLAPGDAAAWRNLGEINLATNDAAAALVAFEQASSLDARDLSSLVQAGTLNAKLDRLPQAEIALHKALGLSPDNVDALCGAMTVAQKQGRPKDAEPLAQRLSSLDAKCRDPAASVTVKPPASPKAQPAAR